MAKGNWLVAVVACAALMGCQSMNGGVGAQGGGIPLTVPQYICNKDENPCKIDTAVEWIILLFPKVSYETMILAPGNKGDVLWSLVDTNFAFKSDGIAFTDGGDKVFDCGLVDPQNGQSQQILCKLKVSPATGVGTKYKYKITVTSRRWGFVWSRDPWVIN